MEYIDGYLLAVSQDKKDEYIEFASKLVPAFKKYGATQVMECWGDDVPDGKLTSFPMAVKAEEGEAVVFSWIVWPDKDTRMAAWPKIEADESLAGLFEDMPFDGKRLIFGGFSVVIKE
ncbi:DUF1428 domain-containing protein [Psychrosphaera ytuae]|uniref:DUF1428 domain-containing protein n=1 Tax=Psychrosphaera ytuae TaxID=2820710 RepID=A0A975DDQ1_9GAMM|nr:DUF1428 domain-containing protein [Psychrosphaera ytuae]QTH64466.1 DUF1428 domain-containing protein [Psychrosphaera ytuae]